MCHFNCTFCTVNFLIHNGYAIINICYNFSAFKKEKLMIIEKVNSKLIQLRSQNIYRDKDLYTLYRGRAS